MSFLVLNDFSLFRVERHELAAKAEYDGFLKCQDLGR